MNSFGYDFYLEVVGITAPRLTGARYNLN